MGVYALTYTEGTGPLCYTPTYRVGQLLAESEFFADPVA
jgi:hypothetical protein